MNALALMLAGSPGSRRKEAMTAAQKLFRTLSRSLDALDLRAAADLLEEQGDDAGAALYRRRAEWTPVIAEALAEEEAIPRRRIVDPSREVRVTPEWLLRLRAAEKTIRYVLLRVRARKFGPSNVEGDGYSATFAEALVGVSDMEFSGWLTRANLAKPGYRRGRIFHFADLSAIREANER